MRQSLISCGKANSARGKGNIVRQRTLLDATERGKRIKDIRLRLAPELGGNVSQGKFGRLVADTAGLEKPFNSSTASRWETGAEPGLIAGCAIAYLGGVTAESLVFEDGLYSGEVEMDEGEDVNVVHKQMREAAAKGRKRTG